MTPEADQPPAPRLDAIVAFLPVFEVPDFSVGSIKPLMHFDYSEHAARFVETAYEDGWVTPTVDWTSWIETEEARRLRDDRTAIEAATVQQLQKLLTALIRQDRFVTGALAGAFESGLLTAIVRRVEQLRLEAARESADS